MGLLQGGAALEQPRMRLHRSRFEGWHAKLDRAGFPGLDGNRGHRENLARVAFACAPVVGRQEFHPSLTPDDDHILRMELVHVMLLHPGPTDVDGHREILEDYWLELKGARVPSYPKRKWLPQTAHHREVGAVLGGAHLGHPHRLQIGDCQAQAGEELFRNSGAKRIAAVEQGFLCDASDLHWKSRRELGTLSPLPQSVESRDEDLKVSGARLSDPGVLQGKRFRPGRARPD